MIQLVLALFMVKHGDAFLFVISMLVMYIVWYSRKIPYQHNIHNIIHSIIVIEASFVWRVTKIKLHICLK